MKMRSTALLLSTMLMGCPMNVRYNFEDFDNAEERAEVEQLMVDLGAREASAWEPAFVRLAGKGDLSVSLLSEAIFGPSPLAERALLVLGEIATDRSLAVVEASRESPRLASWVDRAFLRAETSLANRSTSDFSAGERYLAWFPSGSSRALVESNMGKLSAAVAYSELGGQATRGELVQFARNYPDSPETQQIREALAASFLEDAQGLIRNQDYQGALGRLTLASEWGGQDFVLSTRTRTLVLVGASAASQGNINVAIGAYEEAVRLGANENRALASLYVRQSRASLERGLLLQSVQQAENALSHSSSVHRQVAAIREEQAPILLGRLQSGQAVESIAYALLLTNESTRSILGQYILSQPIGVVGPLLALLSANDAPADVDASNFLPSIIIQIRASLAENVDRHLDHNLAALIGSNVVLGTSQSGPLRDSARTDVERYLEFARSIGEQLEGSELLSRDQVIEALRRGQRPSMASLSRTVRAQLLLIGLDSVREVRTRVRTETTSMVSAFVGRAELPIDLLDWTLLVEQSRTISGGEVRLSSGAVSRVSINNGTPINPIDVTITVDDRAGGLTEPQISDALTVLFGTARLFKSVETEMTGLAVSIMGQSGAHLLTVSLDRRDIDNLAWEIIEAEAPFGNQHLVFIKHDM